jgi:hypothetical protein
MTDLSNLPPEVREAIERFHFASDRPVLRDYILRVTAERDALAKRIADAPVIKEGDNISVVLNAIHGGKRVALVKVE